MKIDGVPPVPPNKPPASTAAKKTSGVKAGSDSVNISGEGADRIKMDKIVVNMLNPARAEERMAGEFLQAMNAKGDLKKEKLKNANLSEKEQELAKKSEISESDFLLAKRAIKTLPDIRE